MADTARRLDQWLWYARIVKTRTLGSELVSRGSVRVNGNRVGKPSRTVREGDVITAAIHGRIRILKILDVGHRRGPAAEAQALYEDLSPPAPPRVKRDRMAPPAHREKGSGRPTKKERRQIDAWTTGGSSRS